MESFYLRTNCKVCLIVGLFVVETHHWALLVSDCLDVADVIRYVYHLYVILILIICLLRKKVFNTSSHV